MKDLKCNEACLWMPACMWVVAATMLGQWSPIHGHPQPAACTGNVCAARNATDGNTWLQEKTILKHLQDTEEDSQNDGNMDQSETDEARREEYRSSLIHRSVSRSGYDTFVEKLRQIGAHKLEDLFDEGVKLTGTWWDSYGVGNFDNQFQQYESRRLISIAGTAAGTMGSLMPHPMLAVPFALASGAISLFSGASTGPSFQELGKIIYAECMKGVNTKLMAHWESGLRKDLRYVVEELRIHEQHQVSKSCDKAVALESVAGQLLGTMKEGCESFAGEACGLWSVNAVKLTAYVAALHLHLLVETGKCVVDEQTNNKDKAKALSERKNTWNDRRKGYAKDMQHLLERSATWRGDQFVLSHCFTRGWVSRPGKGGGAPNRKWWIRGGFDKYTEAEPRERECNPGSWRCSNAHILKRKDATVAAFTREREHLVEAFRDSGPAWGELRKQLMQVSPQNGICHSGYALQPGILQTRFHCPRTAVRGYCILPKSEAFNYCAKRDDCQGVSETSNMGWRRAYPNRLMLAKFPMKGNREWKTCVRVSPQTGLCPAGYALQPGILQSRFHCPRTAVRGYCILPKSEAFNYCAKRDDCQGVSETSNMGWRRAYPNRLMLAKLPIKGNREWKSCVKE